MTLQAYDRTEGTFVRLTPDGYAALATQTTMLEHLGAISGSRENVTLPSGQSSSRPPPA